jgi:hypothetical protein
MRYAAAALALGFGFLVEMPLTSGSGNGTTKNDPWLVDYATARRVARQSGKPIFVVFR